MYLLYLFFLKCVTTDVTECSIKIQVTFLGTIMSIISFISSGLKAIQICVPITTPAYFPKVVQICEPNEIILIVKKYVHPLTIMPKVAIMRFLTFFSNIMY